MKKFRALPGLAKLKKSQETGQPQAFFFCEKSGGMPQFRVESSGDPSFTIERMAGMLAMQCLVRGYEPADFMVLVPAEMDVIARLSARAKELLEEGRSAANALFLSARQREVLRLVICNRVNKEIACRLNISVRTVKFHVSALLSKFGVENRAELARRGAGYLRMEILECREQTPSEHFFEEMNYLKPEPTPINSPVRIPNKASHRPFPRRVLTA
ncbi:MAG: LuxR C-terminal-related transcriptional regulator [Candidatus Acidiferrales bacterium]